VMRHYSKAHTTCPQICGQGDGKILSRGTLAASS
jgi:hypothetical protein